MQLPAGRNRAFTPPAAFHIKATAAMLRDITVNLMCFMVATGSVHTCHGSVQLYNTGPHNFVALDVLISCEMSWMVDCQNNIVEQSALLNPNKY